MLSLLLERCMKRRGVRESDPFDWEKPITTQTIPPTPAITTITTPTPLSPRNNNLQPDNRKDNNEASHFRNAASNEYFCQKLNIYSLDIIT